MALLLSAEGRQLSCWCPLGLHPGCLLLYTGKAFLMLLVTMQRSDVADM